MNRRFFLKTTGLAATAAHLPCLCLGAEDSSSTPKAADEELLARARELINQYRQGGGAIRLHSINGQPLAGARIKLEQQRHDFLFGCNFFRFARVKDPQNEETYRRRFADLLNYATLGFYWPMYEGQKGHPQYE